MICWRWKRSTLSSLGRPFESFTSQPVSKTSLVLCYSPITQWISEGKDVFCTSKKGLNVNPIAEIAMSKYPSLTWGSTALGRQAVRPKRKPTWPGGLHPSSALTNWSVRKVGGSVEFQRTHTPLTVQKVTHEGTDLTGSAVEHPWSKYTRCASWLSATTIRCLACNWAHRLFSYSHVYRFIDVG